MTHGTSSSQYQTVRAQQTIAVAVTSAVTITTTVTIDITKVVSDRPCRPLCRSPTLNKGGVSGSWAVNAMFPFQKGQRLTEAIHPFLASLDTSLGWWAKPAAGLACALPRTFPGLLHQLSSASYPKAGEGSQAAKVRL